MTSSELLGCAEWIVRLNYSFQDSEYLLVRLLSSMGLLFPSSDESTPSNMSLSTWAEAMISDLLNLLISSSFSVLHSPLLAEVRKTLVLNGLTMFYSTRWSQLRIALLTGFIHRAGQARWALFPRDVKFTEFGISPDLEGRIKQSNFSLLYVR